MLVPQHPMELDLLQTIHLVLQQVEITKHYTVWDGEEVLYSFQGDGEEVLHSFQGDGEEVLHSFQGDGEEVLHSIQGDGEEFSGAILYIII